MKKYNISTNLMRVMKNLYDKATSAVLFNGSIGDWFRTTVGVRQGCLLSPTLFNTFLERIIADAVEDHEGTISIRGRTNTNLRFADDTDGLAGKEEELAKLVQCLDKASTAYGMEISALQDGFDQTWWTGDMTIPLQSASFYDRQEDFVWSSSLLDLGTDFLVGNMVFVWDV